MMWHLDEEWAPVYGFPAYDISTHGRVYSYNRNYCLTPWLSDWGYLQVKLCVAGCRVTSTIHRLVGEAFLPGASPDLEVNHIDGDKTYNHISNLEWVTREENVQHGYDTGLNTSKKRRVKNLDTDEVYPSILDAADILGTHPGALSTTINLRGSYRGIALEFIDVVRG